jgi:hypothetical protein
MTNPLNIPTPDREGGSPFGSSFLKKWWECPKKWWYSFLAPHPKGGLGLEGNFLAKPLAIGLAVHKWMEEFYSNKGDIEAANSGLKEWFKAYSGPEILDLEEVDKVVATLIANYIEYNRLHPLETVYAGDTPLVEQNVEVNLGHKGYVYTARLDGIVVGEDGYNYILEHKTVATSRLQEQIGSASLDAQMTGQLFLAFHCLPSLQIQGVLLNCLVKGAGKNNPNKIVRQPVYRSIHALEKFRLDVVRNLEEIDLAIKGYTDLVDNLNMPPYEAARQKFDERGTRGCHWCGYKELCLNPTRVEAFARSFLPRSSEGFVSERGN